MNIDRFIKKLEDSARAGMTAEWMQFKPKTKRMNRVVKMNSEVKKAQRLTRQIALSKARLSVLKEMKENGSDAADFEEYEERNLEELEMMRADIEEGFDD